MNPTSTADFFCKVGKKSNKKGIVFNLTPTICEGKDNPKWVKKYQNIAQIPEFKGAKSKTPKPKSR